MKVTLTHRRQRIECDLSHLVKSGQRAEAIDAVVEVATTFIDDVIDQQQVSQQAPSGQKGRLSAKGKRKANESNGNTPRSSETSAVEFKSTPQAVTREFAAEIPAREKPLGVPYSQSVTKELFRRDGESV